MHIELHACDLRRFIAPTPAITSCRHRIQNELNAGKPILMLIKAFELTVHPQLAISRRGHNLEGPAWFLIEVRADQVAPSTATERTHRRRRSTFLCKQRGHDGERQKEHSHWLISS